MKLDQYLQWRGMSSRQFARKVGATIYATHKYRQRLRIPRRAMMLKIKRATKGKVGPSDWYD